MQVNTSSSSENFAVLGGGQSRGFQIAASAHAFKILSDALYQDKPLAVVRETICNGYDAHVMIGAPERPVEINTSDTNITFRDFGPGIPDEKIVETYCTYFGSTKTSDNRQIGGFGLGCKAPFAITDHFMVTSHHGGMKRTYAMTIGGDENDGAPSVQMMACQPTTETGLFVSIPLDTTKYTRSMFRKVVQKFAVESGLPVKLDGELVENTRNYSGIEKAGFGLFSDLFYRNGYYNQETIKVLYGHVLYPIDRHDDLNLLLHDVGQMIGKTGQQLVIYAPPSSLSLKPDREHLSYNDSTVATLVGLLDRTRKALGQFLPRKKREFIIEQIQGTRRGELGDLFSGTKNRFAPPVPNAARYIGAEQCAVKIASVTAFNGGLETKAVRRVVAHYYRDHAKMLISEHLHNRFHYRGLWRREQVTYRFRQIGRLVRGLTNYKLYYRHTAGESCILLSKFAGSFSSDMCHFYIAESRKDFLQSGKMGVALIISKLSKEELAEIQRKGALYGFKVSSLPSVNLVRAPKREHAPKDGRFVPFLFSKSVMSRYGREFNVPSDRCIEVPTSFFAPALEKRKVTIKPKKCEYGPVQPSTTKFVSTVSKHNVQRVYGILTGEECQTIALPLSIEERNRLVDMGVPRYCEALIDKMKSLVKPKSMDHAVVAHMAMNIGDNYGYQSKYEPQKLAVSIAKINRRLACAVFMQKYRASAALDETYALWSKANQFFSGGYLFLDDIEKAVFADCVQQFEALRTSFEAHVTPEMRAFFKRLKESRLTSSDVPHMTQLANFLSQNSLYHLNEQKIAWLTRLIEREAKEFLRSKKETI